MKLRLKHRGQALLAFICSLVLVLSVFPAHAEDAESLESKTSDLQNQLEGINQELVAISDEISTTEMCIRDRHKHPPPLSVRPASIRRPLPTKSSKETPEAEVPPDY